jgi:peptide/nickel transport system permease protein
MNIVSYLLRRLILIIPLMIGITLVLFAISRLVPIDPITVILPDKALKDPVAVEAAREKWGLNKPAYQQYLLYLVNLSKGDMGISFKTKRPVLQDITYYFPATIELGGVAFLFAGIVGLPLGIAAALRPGKLTDQVCRIIATLGASMPPFWSGLIALFIFNFKFGILPGPGRLDAGLTTPAKVTGLYLVDSLLARDYTVFLNALSHLVLPAIILGWFTLALITRITRSSLLESLQMDYVRTARAKGLKETTVVVRHALRNALIPLVTIFGLSFANLMTGAIMTETIFAWPGIGHYAVMASTTLDYPGMMGTTLIIAILYMLANLVVDVLYAFIDPRIRESQS